MGMLEEEKVRMKSGEFLISPLLHLAHFPNVFISTVVLPVPALA